uniref:Uncharacterized protein n=1 Tax=Panagrolaimus superbus TaxID=310955 RepID=A0A914XWZ7_9BILA
MTNFFDSDIFSNTDLLLAIAIGSLVLNVLVLIAILIILCRQKKQYIHVPTQCVTRKPIRYFPSSGHAPSMVSDYGNLI